VQDYAPYISQIRKDADAVFVVDLGRWTLLFAKQWAASGLKDKMPLIAGGTYTDEHVLPELGDESIGVISAHHYSAALDTPANRRFRAAFEKKYNRLPSFYSENCYTGARAVSEALGRWGTGGGPRRVHGRLRAVEIADAPRGVKMDPYGNPTQNIYIRKSSGEWQAPEHGNLHLFRGGRSGNTRRRSFSSSRSTRAEFPPCRHC
jgi:branched-chain amino acid transport system substrate-binding protein